MKMPDSNFVALVSDWRAAKAAERLAKDSRNAIEDKLLAYVDPIDNGTVHVKHGNVDMKVRFEQVARGDLPLLWDKLPDQARPFVLVPKYEFSRAGYNQAHKAFKFMATYSPDGRKALADLEGAIKESVTFTPSRPYITF